MQLTVNLTSYQSRLFSQFQTSKIQSWNLEHLKKKYNYLLYLLRNKWWELKVGEGTEQGNRYRTKCHHGESHLTVNTTSWVSGCFVKFYCETHRWWAQLQNIRSVYHDLPERSGCVPLWHYLCRLNLSWFQWRHQNCFKVHPIIRRISLWLKVSLPCLMWCLSACKGQLNEEVADSI